MLKHLRLIPVVVCLLWAGTLVAQQRFHNYAGTNYDEYGYGAKHVPWDNGFVVVGSTTYPSGTNDAALYKSDMVGAHSAGIVQARYGIATNSENFYGVSVQTISGTNTFAATGYRQEPGGGTNDLYFVLTDQNGVVLNAQAIGVAGREEVGSNIVHTSDGGFAMTGWSNAVSGDEDLYVVKLDAGLNLQWTRTVGRFGGSDRGYSIIENIAGNIVVAGYSESMDQHNAQGDILVAEFAMGTGAVVGGNVWVYGNVEREEAWCIRQKPTGEYYLTGQTHHGTFGGANIADIFILELSPVFAIARYHQYGRNGDDRGKGIVWDATNNTYRVTGHENSITFGQQDGFFLTVDVVTLAPVPAASWHYGGNLDDLLLEISQVPADNAFYMGGWTQSFSTFPVNTPPNFYHLKTNVFGVTGCNEAMFNPWHFTPAITGLRRVANNSAGWSTNLPDAYIFTPYDFDSLCFFPCKNPHSMSQDLTEDLSQDLVTVHPNPTSGMLSVLYTGTSEMTSTRILDLRGRMITGYSVDRFEDQLNVSDLEAGIYFLETRLGNGNLVRTRFIKQ